MENLTLTFIYLIVVLSVFSIAGLIANALGWE